MLSIWTCLKKLSFGKELSIFFFFGGGGSIANRGIDADQTVPICRLILVFTVCQDDIERCEAQDKIIVKYKIVHVTRIFRCLLTVAITTRCI